MLLHFCVSGDYPLGDYDFNGTVLDQWGDSAGIDVTITFEAIPDVTAFELLGTSDLIDWDAVAGSIDTGFSYVLNPFIEFQYLDAGNYTVNKTLADGYYGFYLDETSLPAGFFEYWAAKGVDAGASGWQLVLWQIINGNLPMFYLKVDGSDYSLIDGLAYLTTAMDTPVRVPGDLPGGHLYLFRNDRGPSLRSRCRRRLHHLYKDEPEFHADHTQVIAGDYYESIVRHYNNAWQFHYNME